MDFQDQGLHFDTILRSHPEIGVIEEKPLINSVEQIINQNSNILDELHKLNTEDLGFLKSLFGNFEEQL